MTLDELTELGLEVRRLGWTTNLESLRRLFAAIRSGKRSTSSLVDAAKLASALGLGSERLPVALRCPECPQSAPRTTDGSRISLNLPDRWVSTCPECGAAWVTLESRLLEAADAKVPAADSDTSLRVLKSGIDTLRVGVYFEWGSEVRAALEEKRAEASRKPETPPIFDIAGVPHEVRILPRSLTGAPYTLSLSAPDWDTMVSTWALGPRSQTPSLMCTHRARALSEFGWKACIARWRKLMVPHAGQLRKPVRMKNSRIALPELVSRLDVHVDIEGWGLGGGALEHARTEAPGKENWFETTEEARARGIARGCSYEFGTRGPEGVFCRIYRKDLQVIARPDARWVLGVWNAAGHVANRPVTRVEFELGRERLKEWRLSKLETLERNLSDSMGRLSSEWLRFEGPHAAPWKMVHHAFAAIGG